MRIKKLTDWEIYVHCFAHRLNLVVVDSCKSVRYASDFFALLQRLHVFLSGSYVHPKWLSLQKATYINENLRHCQTLGGQHTFLRVMLLNLDLAS